MDIETINYELQELSQAYYDELTDMQYEEMLEMMFGQYPQWNDDLVYYEML